VSDCLFCKIRDGEIPGDLVYEGDNYKTIKLVRFNLAWLTAGK